MYKLILALLFTLLVSKVQSQCCLITNDRLQANSPPGALSPFNTGNVPGWTNYNGTPQIDYSSYVSTTSSALFWCNNLGTSEAIRTNQNLSIQAGVDYSFVMYYKWDVSNGANGGIDTITVALLNTSNNAVQKIGSITPVANTNYATYVLCFKAAANFNEIAIWGAATKPNNGANVNNSWIGIDEVHLFQQQGYYAGPDAKICRPFPYGTYIGQQNLCIDSFAGVGYAWWEAGSAGNILGRSMGLRVNPPTTTKYVVQRTIMGQCPYNDTVVVKVGNKTPFDLGPDTSFCNGITKTIGVAPTKGFAYIWNTLDQTSTITVSKKGIYILTIIDTAGCTNSDTIVIGTFPVIKDHVDTFKVCASAFPLKICTNNHANYTYSWYEVSKGKGVPINNTNTYCFDAPKEGTYYCKVKDKMGCVGYDTFNLYIFPPKKPILPRDTIVCSNTYKMIGPSGYKTYTWSTGDRTQSTAIQGDYGTSKFLVMQVTDSFGCPNSDTMVVTFVQRPQLVLKDLNICFTSASISIDHLSNYTGTQFSGDGIQMVTINGQKKYFFDPKKAGCGEHAYKAYYQSTGCSDMQIGKIVVNCGPRINYRKYMCVSSPPLYLQNPGIAPQSWQGIGLSQSSPNQWIFNPAVTGPGHYKLVYMGEDSSGCQGTDTLRIEVRPDMDTVFEEQYIGMFCKNSRFDVCGKDYGDGHIYSWSNGDTGRCSHPNSSGWLKLTITDTLTGCSKEDSIFFELYDCCEMNPDISDTFYVDSGQVVDWSGKKTVIRGTVIIRPGGILRVQMGTLIMQQCSRIIVQSDLYFKNFSPGSCMQGGELELKQSKIIGCDWQGIEVWGYIDYNQAAPQKAEAKANISYCKFYGIDGKGADIAILAAKRLPNGKLDRISGGGRINVFGCGFYNNYIDILFKEYPTYENLSSVTYSEFDERKEKTSGCWVYPLFEDTSYNRDYRGHIIDLTISCYDVSFCNDELNYCGVCNWNPPTKDPGYSLYYNLNINRNKLRKDPNHWIKRGMMYYPAKLRPPVDSNNTLLK